MDSRSKYDRPDQTNKLTNAHSGEEAAAEEHTIDVQQGTAALSDNDQAIAARNVTRAVEDEDRLNEEDTTILGAGGSAGGLSGDGERTDEYDAAVMGIGD
ncbi:hypothetical protein [Spirosoma sp.]|uniref:hypothetical protein n=1 Tax=Spirosoma sp. TaxID=1899569 RepID=UPI003B3AA5B9